MKPSAGVLLLLVAALGGCTQAYYAAMEKIGKEKRDILASRIEDGKKDQEKAKQQFATTLEAFQALTGFSGGNLEKTYKKLSGELESAEKRAKDVRDQIKSIEQVSTDLFREWEAEIDGMTNARFKSQSRTMLRDTQKRYGALIGKMNDGARRMDPVLQAFRDQVVFLKHNLNSRAISSLKETGAKLDSEVAGLVKDLEASIQEADAFIATLRSGEGN
jgi:predicted  nucleic acid-binding Zn-ribbon protein